MDSSEVGQLVRLIESGHDVRMICKQGVISAASVIVDELRALIDTGVARPKDFVVVRPALGSWRVEGKEATTTTDSQGDIVETHPSYAVASFTRRSGLATMFDSEIEHQHYIHLSIREGESRTDPRLANQSRARTKGARPLVEVRMSESQFARLITNMNSGEGNPVTLESHNGFAVAGPLPAEPFVKRQSDRIDKFGDEVKGVVNPVIDELQQFVDDKKRPTLKQMQEVVHSLKIRCKNLKSNAEFVTDMLREDTEDAVSRAKAEVDAYTHGQLLMLGQGELERQRLLPDHTEEQGEASVN